MRCPLSIGLWVAAFLSTPAFAQDGDALQGRVKELEEQVRKLEEELNKARAEIRGQAVEAKQDNRQTCIRGAPLIDPDRHNFGRTDSQVIQRACERIAAWCRNPQNKNSPVYFLLARIPDATEIKRQRSNTDGKIKIKAELIAYIALSEMHDNPSSPNELAQVRPPDWNKGGTVTITSYVPIGERERSGPFGANLLDPNMVGMSFIVAVEDLGNDNGNFSSKLLFDNSGQIAFAVYKSTSTKDDQKRWADAKKHKGRFLQGVPWVDAGDISETSFLDDKGKPIKTSFTDTGVARTLLLDLMRLVKPYKPRSPNKGIQITIM